MSVSTPMEQPTSSLEPPNGRPTTTTGGPRPTSLPEERVATINSWTPAAEPAFDNVAPQDPIVIDCLPADLGSDLYFLKTGVSYALNVLPFNTNQSVVAFELNGVYRSGVFLSQRDSPLSGVWNGESMVGSWDVMDNPVCASFKLNINLEQFPTVAGKLEGDRDGTLTLFDDSGLGPSILIFRAIARVQNVLQPPLGPTSPSSGVVSTNPLATLGDATPSNGAPIASPSSDASPLSSSSSSSSSSGPKVSVLVPAIVVPVVVILTALAAFFLWRQRRRSRMAPSAAFRADHANAVEAVQRSGGMIGLGGTGVVAPPPVAGSSAPTTQTSSYFPLDEKRPLGP